MKLRHGEGSIEQRGDRYRAKWYGLDGVRRSKTFRSRDEAEAHLLEVSGKKRRRRYRDPSEVTVSEATGDWLDRGWRDWKPLTSQGYEARMEKHVLPRFGSRRVVDLTTGEIQAWVDGLKLAPRTVAGVHHALRTMLNECVRLGIITSNPASTVILPRVRRRPRVVWNAAEMRRVLAYLHDDPRWLAVYHLALSTGMRPGELRAVMWQDIDVRSGTVTVRRTAVRTGGVMRAQDETKTGGVRVIALPDACLDALRAWQAQSHSPYVMSKQHDTVLSDVTWREWHGRICRGAGVREIGLHDIRHSVATVLLDRGVDVKVTSAMLGHASVAFTMDTYMHVDTDMQGKAVMALTDVLRTTTEGD